MRWSIVVALGIASCSLGCAARPPTGGPERAAAPEGDLLDAQLRALGAALRQEGAEIGALKERGFLPPAGRVALPVRIEADRCGVFVALASPSMTDLDAALYTVEGVALAQDEGASARPSLTFCAGKSALFAYLTLNAYQGAGSFVAAQFVRARRAEDDLRTLDERARGGALGELSQTLHERGFEDAAPPIEVTLEAQRPVRIGLTVASGECYALAAEADTGLSELSMRLVDPRGSELANGIGDPRLAALQYCASEPADLALEVLARRGRGQARVARFRVAQALLGGSRALWLGEPAPTPEAWHGAKQRIAELRDKRGSWAQELPLQQGQVVELAPPRHRGCERWELVLAPGLARATLRIEDERGVVAERDTQAMQACLVVCAARGERRVTLLGRAGFGRALVQRSEARGQGSAGACSACADAGARAGCSTSSGRR